MTLYIISYHIILHYIILYYTIYKYTATDRLMVDISNIIDRAKGGITIPRSYGTIITPWSCAI